MKPLKILLILLGLSIAFCTYGESLKVIKKIKNSNIINPTQILVNKDRVFVLDRSNENILIFSKVGEFLEMIGGRGESPTEFFIALSISISNEKLFVLDTRKSQIHCFDIKQNKFLSPIKFSKTKYGGSSGQMIASPDGNFYFVNVAMTSDDPILTKRNKDGKPLFSFFPGYPIYQGKNFTVVEEPKTFLNDGVIEWAKNKIYFVYAIKNEVLAFSPGGKLDRKLSLPIPSIEKTVKVITFSDGGFDLERKLNWDMKFRDGKLLVLSWNDKRQSIIFELQNNGKFTEKYRVNESLIGFDVGSNTLYGIEEGDEDSSILLYKLK